jgi:hypothetical protein
MLSGMKKGAVLVDVAIDQGGCFETSHATTHADPTYEVDGVIHYCVANMPGAVPVTSAHALNNATLHYGLQLADKGLKALADDKHLRNGLNVHKGRITNRAVAEALGYEMAEPKGLFFGASERPDHFGHIAQRDAAVAPVLALGRHKQKLLTVADGVERAARNAEPLHQHAAQRVGAALRQNLVGGERADSVGVAFDQEHRTALAAQNALHGGGDVFDLAILRRVNVGRAELEID